jgi:preprotein translocase subunit SecD
MNKNFLWKTVFIIAVMLVALYGIIGIPEQFSKQGVLDSIKNRIHLGLDLKGGTHLILQVQVNDAVRADAERVMERLQEDLKSRAVPYAEITIPDPAAQPDHIAIRGVPPENIGTLREIVTERLPEYNLGSLPDNNFMLSMKPEALSALKDRSVAQAVETIRNRIDQLGVSEPIIEQHGLGEYQILVQLPGVDDPARVKEIMQSTAMLEIRQAFGTPYPTQAAAQAAQVNYPDTIVMKGKTVTARSDSSGTPQESWYLVSRTSAVTGRDLRDAQPTNDEFNKPAVRFMLTGEGGKRFGAFTGAHVNDSLAVVLDNKVQEVANIKEQINDEGRITGSFTDQQAKDLAMVLRSGALPASIKYLQESVVGPSLGADSIKAGVHAAIIGLVAVLIFMLIYYHGAGINADLALILNLIILLGFLGFSGATLTLPGIAGVILTVGMGVDSNVLIFERIREELRNGKTAPSAVEQGFAHAWVTIVDTHVTTIVSAAILFIFGTGPVKGFAVTLTFGLMANLFTAVFVSRTIFDAELQRAPRGAALSI